MTACVMRDHSQSIFARIRFEVVWTIASGNCSFGTNDRKYCSALFGELILPALLCLRLWLKSGSCDHLSCLSLSYPCPVLLAVRILRIQDRRLCTHEVRPCVCREYYAASFTLDINISYRVLVNANLFLCCFLCYGTCANVSMANRRRSESCAPSNACQGCGINVSVTFVLDPLHGACQQTSLRH
jgi:hypothetical protein